MKHKNIPAEPQPGRPKGDKPNRAQVNTPKPASLASQPPELIFNSGNIDYFKDIVNTIREPLLVLDLELRVLTANRNFYKFFKTKERETVGSLVYDLGNQQWDIPALRTLLETILPKKAVFNDYQVDHDFPAIGKRTMLLNARRIPSPPKEAQRILLAFEDITERKRTEEKLHENEERLERMFETVPDGITILESSGQITFANKTAEKILGLKRDGISDRVYNDPAWKITALDGGPFPYEQLPFVRVMQTNESVYDIEHAIEHPDGRRVSLSINAAPLHDEQGDVKEIVATITDITGRKQAEEELRSEKEFAESLIKTAQIIILVLDTQGHIVRFNPYMEAISGYKLSEVQGKDWFITFLPEQNRESTRNIFLQAINNVETIMNVDSILTKDGRQLEIEWSDKALKDNNGNIVGLLAIGQDITERKLVEEKLAASDTELRSLFAAMTSVVIVYDQEGNYIKISPSNSKYFSHQLDEYTGNSVHDLLPKEKADYIQSKIKEALQTGESIPIEYSLEIDGKEVWFIGKVSPFKENTVVWVAQDITERKQVEFNLKERIKELQAFYGLAKIAEKEGITLEQMYQELADILLDSWQYPEIACARIVMDDSEFRTKNFSESAWMQSAPVKVYRAIVGKIEVGYLEKQPKKDEGLFLKEERLRLEAFAENVGLIVGRKQAEDALVQANEQMHALANYWQTAIETERTVIARELHDDFGQSMTALKMDLTWLVNRLPEKDEKVKRIHKMTELVDDSISLMRRIASSLRPGMLDDLGLVAAMEWQATVFSERTGIPCELDLLKKELDLDPTLSTSLFRIFQESLTNVTRHAHAKRVNCSLKLLEQTLILTVQDDGRGITGLESNNLRALGLLGMRERAAQWGGDLTIQGTPGKGTTVTVRIPLIHPITETRNPSRSK